jgi:hypothetical protein
MKLVFCQQIFEKKAQISSFINIRRVGAELFHADVQTDGHDETNSRFLQLCECTWIGLDDMDCIRLAEDGGKWWVVVNTVIYVQLHIRWNFLFSWGAIEFSRTLIIAVGSFYRGWERKFHRCQRSSPLYYPPTPSVLLRTAENSFCWWRLSFGYQYQNSCEQRRQEENIGKYVRGGSVKAQGRWLEVYFMGLFPVASVWLSVWCPVARDDTPTNNVLKFVLKLVVVWCQQSIHK